MRLLVRPDTVLRWHRDLVSKPYGIMLGFHHPYCQHRGLSPRQSCFVQLLIFDSWTKCAIREASDAEAVFPPGLTEWPLALVAA